MITANEMIPVGFEMSESHFEIALMAALAKATSKYNTTVTLTPNTYSLAPIIIEDAVLVDGCDVTQACSVPNVLKNTRIQMNDACNICLTDLSEGEMLVYGIDVNNPEPTSTLEEQKAREQAVKLSYSMLKTYWLGNTSYVGADFTNSALAPAYSKDNGQWKKIVDSSATNVTITQNALLTKALQTTFTDAEVLAYLDAMINAQSVSLQMIMNSEKYIWITTEMFDAVQAQRAKNELAGIRYVQIENQFGNFDSFVYRDIQVIKYEHLSAAIKDLAPSTPNTWELPNRAILTVGLPMLSFPVPTESTYKSEFFPVTKAFKAGTLSTILHPEAVDGAYYVVAY